MDFRHDLLAVLSGGLPALLDGQQPPVQTTLPVESVPPEPQLQDQEPFNLALGSVSQRTVVGIGAGIILLVAVLAFSRR